MKELLKLSTLPESDVDALDGDSGDIGKPSAMLRHGRGADDL